MLLKKGLSKGKVGGIQSELIDDDYLLAGQGLDYPLDDDAHEKARTNEELFEEV